MEILEAMNAHLGTQFSADSPWQVRSCRSLCFVLVFDCILALSKRNALCGSCRIYLMKFFLMMGPEILILKKNGRVMSPMIMIMILIGIKMIAVTGVTWKTVIHLRKPALAAHVVH